MNNAVEPFELAVDAVVMGQSAVLRWLLATNPEIVQARSARPHKAMLLHYVGANGVEDYRQRTPKNALEIAGILLAAGAPVNETADIYGKSTTLGLVASSRHPQVAGLQLELLDLLLKHGALINGDELGALRNGHPQAAEFLANRGARLDFESACGVGLLDLTITLLPTATPKQVEAGFVWACEYGRKDVVNFLLDQGINPETDAGTGLTGLHWAVVGAQADMVQLLLERGASPQTRNRYGGTAMEQALWSVENGNNRMDYAPVLKVLALV